MIQPAMQICSAAAAVLSLPTPFIASRKMHCKQIN